MISPMAEQKELILKEEEPSYIISSSPVIISTAAVSKIDEVNEVVNEKMLDPFSELSDGLSAKTEVVF